MSDAKNPPGNSPPKYGDYWKDSVISEIDRVVLEMRRNIKWLKLLEDEGLGALWVGGGLFPLYSPKSPLYENNDIITDSKDIIESPKSQTKPALHSFDESSNKSSSPQIAEQTKDLYTFGKIGVRLGLTVFTLGDEYIPDILNSPTQEVLTLKNFLELRASLKSLFDNQTIPILQILYPFLQIIKSGIATGPIVRTSLESIHRLIKNDLIDFCSENGKAAIIQTSHAVTHCKFEATDSLLDETVLLQILEVLRLIMTSKYSNMLSDTAVCEMLEAVLSMACQMRINDILRRASELTLLELVDLVFKKTNSPSETSNILPSEFVTESSYGIASVHELLRVLVMLTNPHNLQYTDTMRHLSIKALHTAIQTSGFYISNFVELKSLVLNDLCHNLLLITNGNNPNLIISALRLLLLIFQTQGSACKVQLELFLCQIVGRLMTPTVEPSGINNKSFSNLSDLKSSTTKLSRPSFKDDSVSNKSVSNPSDIPKRPVAPDHQNISEKLSSIDLENEVISISKHESLNLVDPPSNSQEVNIYKNSNMKAGVRGHIAEGEVRRVLLEGLHRFLTLSPRVISSLWVNFDCDPQLGNVFNFFMTFITMKSVPWPGTRLEIESEAYMDILLYYLHNMSTRNGVGSPNSGWRELIVNSEYYEINIDESYPFPSLINSPQPTNSLPSIETLLERKKTKDMMMYAANLFNQKPSLGVSFLQKAKFLPTDNSTQMIIKLAQFLRSTPALNKKLVGEYISKPSSSEVLQAYLELFDFKNKRLDEAARMLLGTFRLPGESQQISRIMQAFSAVYFSSHPPDIATKDSAFVLSFAIIMLNTDLHNPQVKNRMKFEDFSKNLRNENDGQDFSPTFLSEIYKAIQSKEIVFPEEHEGEAGFEYAWKEMLSKDNGIIENSNGNTNKVDSNTVHTDFKHNFVPWLALQDYDVYDRALFISVWPRILQSLTLTVVHCSNDHVFRLALSGLYSLLGIASKFNLTDCIDETTHFLAQISGLFDPGFISDIGNPLLVECSNTGMDIVAACYDSYEMNELISKSPIDFNKDLLVSELKKMSDFNNNVQLSHKAPEPTLRFCKSNTLSHWEAIERTRIPLVNLGIKLGKDYCAQIALICIFLIPQEWPSSLGYNGWKIISKIVRSLVDSDLLPPNLKRVRNLVSGISTIPRSDTLHRYILAKNSALEESLGNSPSKSQDKIQTGGGLFSAISSFLGGAPVYKTPSFMSEFDQEDNISYSDNWYFDSDHRDTINSNLAAIDGIPEETYYSGDLYIVLYDQLDRTKSPIPNSQNYDRAISKLKQLKILGTSRWSESTEMLVQLVFSSRKCIDACKIDNMVTKVCTSSEDALLLFLNSISSTYLEALFSRNSKSLEPILEPGFKQNGLKGSSDLRSDDQGSTPVSPDSTVFNSFSPTSSYSKRKSSSGHTRKESSSIKGTDTQDQASISGSCRRKYEPSLLFFVELIGSMCEESPDRIPLIWNVFERSFRKTLEHADSIDLFIIERLSGVLMRIIISSLFYLEDTKSSIPKDDETMLSEPICQIVDIIERVFRCIGLLRDSNNTTFESTEETLGMGLRIIAAMDISVLLSVNNWPIISSLLSSLSKLNENSPEYPSNPGRFSFEIVMKLVGHFRDSNSEKSDIFLQTNLSYFDLIDFCTKFMPPEKFLASVSGGNNLLSGNNDISRNFEIKTSRQQNAYKMAYIILNEISELQIHIRKELFIYTYGSETPPDDVFSTPVLSSNSSNSLGSQLLSYWLRTMNTLSSYCSSRHKEIRNISCQFLQKSLDRSELVKLRISINHDQDKSFISSSSSSKSNSSGYSLPPYWVSSILQRVLLPLMDGLLRSDFLTDYTMEDTHIKCLSILVNFFLQHIPDLLSYNSATDNTPPQPLNDGGFSLPQQQITSAQPLFDIIWMRVLHILVGYMKIGSVIRPSVPFPANHDQNNIASKDMPQLESPSLSNYTHPATLSLFLAEISQEQLKNLVLVLDSLNVFSATQYSSSESSNVEASFSNVLNQNPNPLQPTNGLSLSDSTYSDVDYKKNFLWSQTWDVINEVNPNLKDIWFSVPDSPKIVKSEQHNSNDNNLSTDSLKFTNETPISKIQDGEHVFSIVNSDDKLSHPEPPTESIKIVSQNEVSSQTEKNLSPDLSKPKDGMETGINKQLSKLEIASSNYEDPSQL
ncbi:hypothetical protein AYI68_g7888 [Smittium mucronatum]|uniref:SEC7 domain-containing protein n=1 Tax=Smittium mucronatum TaxID=133383 RepID=A0A1R0GME7_9FUNG|nr:hypothetical protein AYI68_g7888 [Smittium mucronatum]